MLNYSEGLSSSKNELQGWSFLFSKLLPPLPNAPGPDQKAGWGSQHHFLSPTLEDSRRVCSSHSGKQISWIGQMAYFKFYIFTNFSIFFFVVVFWNTSCCVIQSNHYHILLYMIPAVFWYTNFDFLDLCSSCPSNGLISLHYLKQSSFPLEELVTLFLLFWANSKWCRNCVINFDIPFNLLNSTSKQ